MVEQLPLSERKAAIQEYLDGSDDRAAAAQFIIDCLDADEPDDATLIEWLSDSLPLTTTPTTEHV